jgi:hypothetical protein
MMGLPVAVISHIALRGVVPPNQPIQARDPSAGPRHQCAGFASNGLGAEITAIGHDGGDHLAALIRRAGGAAAHRPVGSRPLVRWSSSVGVNWRR